MKPRSCPISSCRSAAVATHLEAYDVPRRNQHQRSSTSAHCRSYLVGQRRSGTPVPSKRPTTAGCNNRASTIAEIVIPCRLAMSWYSHAPHAFCQCFSTHRCVCHAPRRRGVSERTATEFDLRCGCPRHHEYAINLQHHRSIGVSAHVSRSVGLGIGSNAFRRRNAERLGSCRVGHDGIGGHRRIPVRYSY